MTSDDLDYALALSLQEQFTQEQRRETIPESETDLERRYDPKLIVDERWELLDPHPKVHDLFVQFDAMFFDRKLVNAGVEVRWSPRMTLCAGVCSYEGRGGLCSVRLSVPLLKLRPRKDLVETLLHEMIHALLFVTENNTDHDGHGPNFCFHMKRINSLTGANITIYHTFHQEVKQYRQHWWRCNGPCRNRPPYYGWVKRAMNRAPSPRDRWWDQHQHSCGGSYSKVKEPENYGKKKIKSTKQEFVAGDSSSVSGKLPSGCRNIKDMMNKEDKKETKSGPQVSQSTSGWSGKAFGGKGHSLLSSGEVTSNKQPVSQCERRQKLLEAAEKRRQIAQVKGVKRKNKSDMDSHDIRTYYSTPTSQDKKPKLSRHHHHREHDNLIPDHHRPTSTDSDWAYEPSPSSSRGLSDGGGDRDHDVVNLLSGSDDDCGKEQETVVVIDDDCGGRDMLPLRMCPVCGLTDIPLELINTHVAYCLDGEETVVKLE